MEYPGYILSNRLPSVKSIHAFTDELINYLFPVTDEPEMFMEHHESELYKLQTRLQELLCSIKQSTKLKDDEICDRFFAGLSQVKGKLIQDAQLILDFDPAASSFEEVILSYPGFYAILVHRLAHILYLLKVPLIPRFMSEWAHSKTGI